MAYIRKTRDYYKIEQYTGPQYGWEEVCGSYSQKEARANLKEYRENQPEYPVRMRKTRETVPADLIFSQVCSRCGATVQIFAHQNNKLTYYTTSDGAKISTSRQYVNCACAPYAQFKLSNYGVNLSESGA